MVAPKFVILSDTLKGKTVVIIFNYMRRVLVPLMKAIPRVTFFRVVVFHRAVSGLQRFKVRRLQTLRPTFHHELNLTDLRTYWFRI